jgi:hypothetical protein
MTQRRVIGVDCASQPKNVGLALCVVGEGSPRWISGSASGACKDQHFVAVATSNQRDFPQLSRARSDRVKDHNSLFSEHRDDTAVRAELCDHL